MLIKKEKKGNVTIYYVDKNISDDKMDALSNTYVKPNQIELTIDDDADVYTVDNQLLLRFRKGKLSKAKVDDFYDGIIKFAKKTSSNRGSTSGSANKNVYENPKVMSNIFGFFDKFSPSQKVLIKKKGKKLIEVRECRFNMDFPENFKQTLPLIKEIDHCYEQYVPDKYAKQKKKANQTAFKINGTSFTTVTTNVNFQTTIHKDRGDDSDGFGNLAVIEKGKYSGGETCFPQYGIGVNVRTGDILLMNVHELHGNLPIKLIDKDAIRLSIVCYLRYKIWEKTKNKTKKFMITHNKTVKSLRTT
jgi:hypothetical protein